MSLMRSILRVLRTAAAHRPASIVHLPHDWSPADWNAFEQYAYHHRVASLLAHHVQHGNLEQMPDPWFSRMQKELHRTRLRHGAALRALEELEAALLRAGIPSISLKGPRLAEEAYEAAGLRAFDDLDILVDAADVAGAHQTLLAHGYRRNTRSLPVWLVQRYHFHSQWLHPDTHQCVELHWRPADARTLPPAADVASYVRDLRERPAAMAVYLAVHIAKHDTTNALLLSHRMDPLLAMHPWSGIRWIWLLDFEGLCASRNLSAAELEDTARRWNARAALALTKHLITPPHDVASGSDAGAPARFSVRAALVRRMAHDHEQSDAPKAMPWWIRAQASTGFRPIRLLDLFPQRTP